MTEYTHSLIWITPYNDRLVMNGEKWFLTYLMKSHHNLGWKSWIEPISEGRCRGFEKVCEGDAYVMSLCKACLKERNDVSLR